MIRRWKSIVDSICEFTNKHSEHHFNEDRIPKLYRELYSFLQLNEPALRRWTMEYLEKNRKFVMRRWWSAHLIRWSTEQVSSWYPMSVHPRVLEEWDQYVGTVPFSTIHREVMKLFAIRDVSCCDVPSILAIHKDKPCDDPMYCFLCDETYERWNMELKARLRVIHDTMCYSYKEPPPQAIENWSPPHIYDKKYSTLREYKMYITEQYTTYFNRCATSRELIETLLIKTIHSDSPWVLSSWNPHDSYDFFTMLWDKLDYMLFATKIDMICVERIESIRGDLKPLHFS